MGAVLQPEAPSVNVPSVHFVANSRQSASAPMDTVTTRLTAKFELGLLSLRGPRTAFHELMLRGKADMTLIDGVPALPITFAAPRRPQQRRAHVNSVKGWVGVLLHCEVLDVTYFVADGQSGGYGDYEVWVLDALCVTRRAVFACLHLCRFGCGCVSNAPAFDTCCRSCAVSHGEEGHDEECRGRASEELIMRSREVSTKTYCFEWQDDQHKWHEYDDTTSWAIAGTIASGGSSLRLTLQGRHYEIDVKAMRQSSKETGRQRLVRKASTAEASEDGASSTLAVAGGVPARTRCAICFDDAPPGTTPLCSSPSHIFCQECLWQHVRTELEDKGVLPACPLSSECNHLYSSAQVRAVLGNGDASEVLRNRFTLIEQRGRLQAMAAFPCATCEDWLIPHPQSAGPQHFIECPGCKTRFCSACRRRPFHFRVSCSDVARVQAEWHEWLRGGRDLYLERRVSQDPSYRPVLEALHSKKAEQRRMLEEAEARNSEAEAMEKWKSEKCKCCPRCSRVIEKLSGCDLMRCGANYHGGDVQNGCGHKFKWSEAPAYVPATVTTPTARVDASLDRVVWQIERGLFLRCAMCKCAVEGPLFLCIDCDACCACLLCANGQGAAAGRRHKADSHVFAILWKLGDLSETDLRKFKDSNLATTSAPPGFVEGPVWGERTPVAAQSQSVCKIS